jgi:hypothetical protein
VCDATTASDSTTATDFTSIAGVVIRGRRAEPPALVASLFNTADPKPQKEIVSALFTLHRGTTK